MTARPIATTEEKLEKPIADLAQPPQSRVFAAAILFACLLWFCFYPLNWGWLGWVALVPYFVLVRSPDRPRRIYFAVWLGAFAFFLLALKWMRLADPRMYATWFMLASWCSVFFLPAHWVLRRLVRRWNLPIVIAAPVVWLSLEFVRANFPGGFVTEWLGHWQHDFPVGFAWYFLGHTQHAFTPVIQIADIGGAYAVTFVVVAVNAIIFEWLCRSARFRNFFGLPKEDTISLPGLTSQTIGVGLLVVSVVGYGCYRLSQTALAPGPKLSLLQGNLDQRIRNTADSDETARETMRQHYARLCRIAAKQDADLTVWPETSYDEEWFELSEKFTPDKLPDDWKKAIAKSAKPAGVVREWVAWTLNHRLLRDMQKHRRSMLVGLNARVLDDPEHGRRFNSAVLIRYANNPPLFLPKKPPFHLRYDKMHRVPFGEFIPLATFLPWLNRFAPYDYDYVVDAGETFTRFPLRHYRFGVVICFEDTDPRLARAYVRDDTEAVDFLINISNDGWFIGSEEHDEHLAICRFRAVECRRSIARAVNMGISALIDGNGRIVQALPKKSAGVLTVAVPLDRRTSLYARWGDWLPWSCAALILIGLAADLLVCRFRSLTVS
ncbi:MAG: apolipoprotein N-acyltransferase 1 [Gemmatales bacterium]|nr:MAG: apolipoprotein N-acyltransferase 1 [Gemmatales bacterium]